MCEELDKELVRGNRLAEQLCRHMEQMGAAQLVAPVTIGWRSYTVTVERHFAVDEEKHEGEG